MEEKHTLDSIIAKYGQPVPNKPKKWLFILVALIVVVVSALVAVSILAKVKNAPVENMPPTAQTSPGPTPTAVIDKIATNETVMTTKNYSLFRGDATQQDAASDTTKVIFAQKGYNFLTNIAADDGLRFSLTDAKLPSSRVALTTVIDTVLTTAGFTKAAQNVSALSSYDTVSYVNKGTICQVISFTQTKRTTNVLEQGVMCITRTSLEASYSAVKSSLTKADIAAASSAQAINQNTISDGAKKLLTLTVTPKDSKDTTNYYFATLGKEYAYLGKRATPSVDNKDSYSLSDELKKNSTDPKWGSFLTDNIK